MKYDKIKLFFSGLLYKRDKIYQVNITQDMSGLKLYQDPLSQPTRAVIALLKIGKVQYDAANISLMKQEQRQPQYKAINPFGTVPTLVHNKLTLCESNAILYYLCEAFPAELGKYGGANLEEKALIQQHLSWYQGTYRPSLIRILRLQFVGMLTKTPVNEAELTEGGKKMQETLGLLDGLLGEKPYLVGNNLTIADLLIFEETTNIEFYKLDLAPWKNVKAWYDRMLTNEVIAAIHNQFLETAKALEPMFKQKEGN